MMHRVLYIGSACKVHLLYRIVLRTIPYEFDCNPILWSIPKLNTTNQLAGFTQQVNGGVGI